MRSIENRSNHRHVCRNRLSFAPIDFWFHSIDQFNPAIQFILITLNQILVSLVPTDPDFQHTSQFLLHKRLFTILLPYSSIHHRISIRFTGPDILNFLNDKFCLADELGHKEDHCHEMYGRGRCCRSISSKLTQ